jgi:hypothetical protein
MEVHHASMDLGPAKEFLYGSLDAYITGVDGLAMRRIVVPVGNREVDSQSLR